MYSNMFFIQDILTDVTGKTKLFGRDENETDAGVTNQGIDQRMNGTAEFQVATETDGQIVETSF